MVLILAWAVLVIIAMALLTGFGLVVLLAVDGEPEALDALFALGLTTGVVGTVFAVIWAVGTVTP